MATNKDAMTNPDAPVSKPGASVLRKALTEVTQPFIDKGFKDRHDA